MTQKNKPRAFDATQWNARKLEEMTNRALQEKQTQFASQHTHDTQQQLLEYVRQCARELGHTPYMSEVIGGSFIAWRFGTWREVLAAAMLEPLGPKPSPTSRRIYREELERQKQLHQLGKAEKKEERHAARREKSEAARVLHEQRIARDNTWGEEHGGDTDEMLIAYVKQCAQALGHAPAAREVLGGEYIRSRFGRWGILLSLAELPLPKDVRPPSKKEMQDYYERRKEELSV